MINQSNISEQNMNEVQTQLPKRPYTLPQLVVYGSAKRLTTGGSRGRGEQNKGKGDGKKRNRP
jgi:hypothetical protein